MSADLPCGCKFAISDTPTGPELLWDRCARHDGAVRFRLRGTTVTAEKPK